MLARVGHCSSIQLYLRYGIYDSPIPATFLRKPVQSQIDEPRKTRSSRRQARACHLKDDHHCSIILTSEATPGSTGIVHFGTLGIDIERSPVLSVGVKIACTDYEQELLTQERHIYMHLRAQGVKGIPTVLGFFDALDDDASCLVLLHCGRTLSDMTLPIPSSAQYAMFSSFMQLPDVELAEIRYFLL
jgi:hypothetical protein